MFKKTVVLGAAAALMMTMAAPAEAGRKGKAAAIGIFAAIGAAAAIAAAANAAQKRRHDDRYLYSDRISDRDNAVAACLHKAHRRNLREGGDGIEFVNLSRAKRKRRGYIIGIFVDRFGPWGVDRQYAKCRIKHDHVVAFSWEH